jgi:hypothetical protein
MGGGGAGTAVAIGGPGPLTGIGAGGAMMAKHEGDDTGQARGAKGRTFRGGSKRTRDNWYGYESDQNFVRWWHRQGKAEFGGGDIETAAEAKELFEYWVSIGKPSPK